MNAGTDRTLTREQIVDLLQELGAELQSRGVHAQLFVVGGAAMALAFNTRRMTGDVDGVFEPKAAVYEAARLIAGRHEGLPPDWLNDSVKGLLPGPDPDAKVILDLPGITVSVPSPRYLLALKVQAARADRDDDDIRFLARLCGANTADEVLAIAETVIGRNRLLPKAQYVVQEMFGPDGTVESESWYSDGKHHRTGAPAKPDPWRRFIAWVRRQGSRSAAQSPTPAKPSKSAKPPRCGGRTKSGKHCVLRAGHAGYHHGR